MYEAALDCGVRVAIDGLVNLRDLTPGFSILSSPGKEVPWRTTFVL